MKIRILKAVACGEYGLMTGLSVGQIINVDSSFAKELVDKEIAEYVI